MESSQLLEIIYLLEDSYIGEYVRGSLWLFPVIQSFHLLGLGILGGAVVIGDLRLVGLSVSYTHLTLPTIYSV